MSLGLMMPNVSCRNCIWKKNIKFISLVRLSLTSDSTMDGLAVAFKTMSHSPCSFWVNSLLRCETSWQQLQMWTPAWRIWFKNEGYIYLAMKWHEFMLVLQKIEQILNRTWHQDEVVGTCTQNNSPTPRTVWWQYHIQHIINNKNCIAYLRQWEKRLKMELAPWKMALQTRTTAKKLLL